MDRHPTQIAQACLEGAERSFPGRHAAYFGRTAETHAEAVPPAAASAPGAGAPTPNSDAIPREIPRPLAWLDPNWPFAGTVVAAFLLVVLPLVLQAWGAALVLVYVLLVVYLIHQIEEHYGDRFRRDINATLAGGADALTPRATMWINVGGVWGIYALTLVLAGLVDVGFGLVAVYTTLVNALAHVAGALATRRSNPGLWTAIGLFGPVGALAWRVVGAASGLGWVGHGLGLGVALVLHAAIIRHVRGRARALGVR